MIGFEYPEFTDEERLAAILATRFSYGVRPGDLYAILPDPIGWLDAQLIGQDIRPELQGLPNGPTHHRETLKAQATGQQDKHRGEIQQQALYEASQHALTGLTSPLPFRERLIRFWTNHFTLSAAKDPRMLPLVAAFERDAIRPYVNGRLVHMLMAVVQHPAMLIFMGNHASVGPDSNTGRATRRQLDLTLAEAILARFTLGRPKGGVKGDVIALAGMLSGWSIGGLKSKNPGGFLFKPERHEGNKKRFMERIYPEAGMMEAEAALDLLTHQPETGWHLAQQMAMAFVADSPSEKLVSDIVDGYADSGGNLGEMAKAMIRSPEAQLPQQQKIKTPEELIYSTYNALDLVPATGQPIYQALQTLGQRPYHAPTELGWPMTSTYWVGRESILERLEWLSAMAQRSEVAVNGLEYGFAILGPQLSERTARQLAIAQNPIEATALLLASPEFQRR